MVDFNEKNSLAKLINFFSMSCGIIVNHYFASKKYIFFTEFTRFGELNVGPRMRSQICIEEVHRF